MGLSLLLICVCTLLSWQLENFQRTEQNIVGPYIAETVATAPLTGKSLSEALIFVSTNPQYDNRLFIGLQIQYMKFPSSERDENMLRTCCLHKLFLMSKQKQKTIYVSNMFLRCSQHVLIRELLCTELVILWTIWGHVMG